MRASPRHQPTTPGGVPPLVGRDRERRGLSAAVEAGRHVLLLGPPGVGKTRLVDHVVAAAERRHRPVDRVLACAGTRHVALAALAPLGAPGAHDGVGPRIEWHLGRWRSRGSGGTPALVWVDDSHHLDDVTAALLRQAIARGHVQLLLTARTSEPLPEDLVSLRVTGTLEARDLAPLGDAAARRLTRWCAGGSATAPQVDEIVELSAGYPLFLRELASGPRTGRLSRHGVGRAVLGSRVARLPWETRRTAELIALAQPVPAALLDDWLGSVNVLTSAGLVVREGERLRLDHPLRAELLAEELGPQRAQRFQELARRAEERPGLVDPLLLIEWVVAAGGRPRAEQAAHAVRIALARTDTATALGLLDHVTDGHNLLLGQALAVDGDLGRGLELLEQVRRDSPVAAHRVEAASLLARHLGLTRQDFTRAHAVLTSTESSELTVGLRRHLLVGRLWLRLFGPTAGPAITPDSDLLVAPEHGDDQLAYDIATAAASLFLQTAGTTAAEPFRDRFVELERSVEVDEVSWCRARAVAAWFEVLAGNPAQAFAAVASAARRAWDHHWLEGYYLLVGNAAVLSCLVGRPRADYMPDGWDHLGLEPDESETDLYRYQELASAAWRACCALAAPDESCPCRDAVPIPRTRSGSATPLLDALLVRAGVITAEAAGHDAPGAPLPDVLTTLAHNEMNGWLAFVYSETCDLTTPPSAHRTAAEALRPFRDLGLYGLAGEAARSRVAGDPAALLRVADGFAERGFVVPATRAYADVTRLSADHDARLRAIRGLAAAHTQWEGAAMPWLRDVAGLPSQRQLEVARAVAADGDVAAVAERLCLSRRTVENHVYRTSRSLGVSARSELAEALAHPCPDTADLGPGARPDP